MEKGLEKHIPKVVSQITETLEREGFQAFLVGGCVRDLLLGNKPNDWDIATNAVPHQIIALFTNSYYENTFGTVSIVNGDVTDETLKIVEITPYRLEGKYSDSRHPDTVLFSQNIEDDLKRRDFTINALAYNNKPIDLFDGAKDLKQRIIRTVGNPDERFIEDPLRIIRAVRLSATLDFEIEAETLKSIVKNKDLLKNISQERIRDEFIKVIMNKNAGKALILAKELNIMSFIIPELEEGYSIGQNKAHKYDVFEHLLRTFQCSVDKNFSMEVRLAALLHDVGKPRSRRWAEDKKEWTFYGHDVIGTKLAQKILERLKFPKKTVEVVTKLVRWHMFFSDTEQITLSAVRRMVANVGREYIWDLMDLRVCDRVGTGRPKENPYRLRKYRSMIEEALHDPISVGMLKIDGKQIMEVTKTEPSPKIGHILHALLEEVLEDPKLNTKEHLEKRAIELNDLDIKELEKIGKSGKEKKDIEEEKKIDEIRKKHWVQ